MSNLIQQTLGDTLEYLMALWRENAVPDEARARLRRLQDQHRQIPMDLVWEKESYAQAVHYDVLLRPSEAGTISLSFCPDRAIPWPLRRAQHSRESEIVRVNGHMVTVQMVMSYLDFIWDESRLITRLVDICFIQDEIEKREILVCETELQQAMDLFRSKHQLYTAGLTADWLRRHGQTQEVLERTLEAEVAAAKLRDQIAEGKVEDYFASHSSDFDTARIARFKVGEMAHARSIIKQIHGGELNFFEAAREQFCVEGSADGKLFAAVRRRDLSRERATAIFDASPGATVGPVPSGDGFELVNILKLNPARLDETTRSAIKEVLFEDWLAEQRREATIEWFWGDTARAPSQQPGSDSASC